MKTTVASGRRSDTCSLDSLPQSTRPVFEIPVPTCGSRSTSIPSSLSARRRAISTSSGMASESPVTSSLSSARGGSGLAPSSAGSKESGETAGTAPESERRPSSKPAPAPAPSSSRKARASSPHSSKGRRSATQPAGSPTVRTTSRWNPGRRSSPAWRTDEPSKSTSTTTDRNTTTSASRARRRGPRGGSGTL